MPLFEKRPVTETAVKAIQLRWDNVDEVKREMTKNSEFTLKFSVWEPPNHPSLMLSVTTQHPGMMSVGYVQKISEGCWILFEDLGFRVMTDREFRKTFQPKKS